MSDIEIRRAAFAWLGEQVDVHGQVLSRELLGNGFPYAGERIPLVSPQGIFKPRQMELPLSIKASTYPDRAFGDLCVPGEAPTRSSSPQSFGESSVSLVSA